MLLVFNLSTIHFKILFLFYENVMNSFNFCWKVLEFESQRTSVCFNKNNCNVKNEYEEEFDKPIKRVSYLYKYGSFNIYFLNHCLSGFIAEVPDSLKIIDKICLIKNLNICSLSTGPGTYVIGFLNALHLLGKPLKNSVNFKFISKHIAWRNVVCQMFNSIPLIVPESSSCKLIQWDVLSELTPKAQSYIKIADVLFLCHTFSSTKTNKDVTYRVLKDILQLLKPGALSFFIFNEDLSNLEFNTSGHFLYGPTKITLKDMPYNKTLPDMLQVPIVDTGSSFFGVWRKSNSVSKSSSAKPLVLTSINKCPESQCCINITKSGIAQHISKPQDSFKLTNNTSASDSIVTEAISSEDMSIPVERNASLKNDATEPKSNCISHKKFAVKNKPWSLSTKTDSAASTQKTESYTDNSTNVESSLNSLVKTLERLVTNLEGFVDSQNTVGNYKDPQCFLGCPVHFQNMCAGTCYARHNFNRCACNRYHLPCIENRPVCSNSYHHSMSNKHHFCQNVESRKPHIVIPLQNITENVLAEVFSLVSQVNSSSH